MPTLDIPILLYYATNNNLKKVRRYMHGINTKPITRAFKFRFKIVAKIKCND